MNLCSTSYTALDAGTSQSEKAKDKIQYKIQSKYNRKV